ncbi:MAG: choice-of-anchor B family protein [Gemmatimonadales bacterium]
MPTFLRWLMLLFLAAPLSAQSRYAWQVAPAAPIGFASAVKLQGNELFVGRTGAVQGFPLNPSHPGAIHVFQRAGEAWRETTTMTSDDLTLGDRFGSALAVSGNVVVVGAPNHGDNGAAYVFEKRGSSWVRTARLDPPAGGKGDEFGLAVALDGALLVVSAPSADSSRGVAYAYRRDRRGKWSQPMVIARGGEPHDRFGRVLALTGNRVLIGVPGPVVSGPPPGHTDPNPLLPKPGAAVVYRGDGTRWTEEARLTAGADSATGFGFAVHLTPGEALVGMPGGIGAVYVFRSNGGKWEPAGKLVPAAAQPNTLFGFTLARTDGAVFVGAQQANENVGEVHVFRPDGALGWRETQVLTTRKNGLMAQFGGSITAAGDAAVIGSPMNDFFEGTAVAYARDRATGEWKERGTVTDKPVSLPAITGRERKCESGKIEIFSCEQVDLEAFLPNAAIGGKRGIMLNDIWGWTDPTTNREYALVGRMDGTSFVDVTDGSNPVYLGNLPLHAGATANLWRGIRVYKDHAFIVADGAGPHGMQVFDLTQLRNVKNAPVTFTETAHYDRIWSAHTIALNEETGFAYPSGNSAGGETCGGGLHMIDVRDPRNPTFAGCYADPSTGLQRTGYTHETQCVVYKGPDSRYHGREICFNSSETAVGIADVTDKKAPKPIAVASYPNTAYTHQGWLTEDQKYFYVNDEGDEIGGLVPRTRTLVWDVSNLEEPVLVKEFLGTTSATDHNLYVRGRYMYQSNYVAGLRVIDISDPVNPRESAYFDTVPFGEDVPGFAGTWTNYPFFKSGTIVLTSMREGLFIVKHRPQEPLTP